MWAISAAIQLPTFFSNLQVEMLEKQKNEVIASHFELLLLLLHAIDPCFILLLAATLVDVKKSIFLLKEFYNLWIPLSWSITVNPINIMNIV